MEINIASLFLHRKIILFFRMRRDTLVALGAVCLIFWAGIYFLFSLKPPQPAPVAQTDLVDRTQ